ncbi:MAG: ABC transporter substrate-binding protein [Gammaproteobacteria bacterium]|nr:ABC transporter substrate-binding protein [Gammaproteobacteria bacterium]
MLIKLLLATKYKTLCRSGLIIACLFQAACLQSEAPTLRVGTNIWLGYEPLYLAQELGHWTPDEIRLTEYPSATDVLRAFRNQSIQAASLTLDEVLQLRQDRIPVKIILVHDISQGGDAILAKPPVTTVKQLKGKRIGVENNALGAFVVTRALELNNMSINDVKIVSSSVNEHISDYEKNRIDAVVTFEPSRTKLLNAGASEIFNSKQIPGEIVDVLVVHEKYFSKHPGRIKHLIRGWFKAVDYLANRPADASAIISRRLGTTTEEILYGLAGLHIPDMSENIELLDGEKAKLLTTLTHLNRVMSQHGLIQGRVNTDNLLSSSAIKE